MVRLWTANRSVYLENEGIELLRIPPWHSPSICFGRRVGPDNPESLFADTDYWDLCIPHSNEPLAERLSRLDDWADVEGWIARRDTPQSRWLDRLYDINGHLGRSIIELIEKKSLTVKQI